MPPGSRTTPPDLYALSSKILDRMESSLKVILPAAGADPTTGKQYAIDWLNKRIPCSGESTPFSLASPKTPYIAVPVPAW
ncbi:hypothetical protein AXG93_593s1100 [Marchantia polymorpha subsp. ruderalis]|uniref:Uncharacterized protein n=1 Tax=Marchantia polymorpha subsp. ruderalis TaxID=1480154 RepID=A0A176WQ58_MARPO|nr:hypothetical protein AXG93_593s1100 [Marchantia polymorpha subsp. ruderalis]